MQNYLYHLCSAILLLTSLHLSAQQTTTPRREIGIQFSQFNLTETSAFSAIYKKQIRENTFRRYRLAFGDIDLSRQGNQDANASFFNLGGGFAIGTEHRKLFGAKTTFFRGWEWNAYTQFNYTSNANNQYLWRISAGVGYVLAIQHQLNKYLAVNLEITPGISATYQYRNDGGYYVNTAASFTSNAALAVMYTFGGG